MMIKIFRAVILYSPFFLVKKTKFSCCCSVAQSCPTLCNPMDCNTPGFPILQYLLELLKFMSLESVMLSNHLTEQGHKVAGSRGQSGGLISHPESLQGSYWDDTSLGTAESPPGECGSAKWFWSRGCWAWANRLNEGRSRGSVVQPAGAKQCWFSQEHC